MTNAMPHEHTITRTAERIVVNVSPSLLADVLSCGTKGWVRHVKGYCSASESIKLTAGSAIHAGIAATLEGKSMSAALMAFAAIYEPAFAALPADALPEQAYLPRNLAKLLARWIETSPPHTLPWLRALSVEEAFTSRTFEFGNVTVNLIVRPDAVVEDRFGGVRWVDTKTTGWRIGDKGWRANLRLSLQAALYTDAVVQRYGARAVLGGWFNAMEIRNLPGSTDGPPKLKKDGTPMKPRVCHEHGKAYADCAGEHANSAIIECLLSPERVIRAVHDAEQGARKFLALLGNDDADGLDMNGTAHGACRFCANSTWCEAGRLPSALPSMLKYEPWIVEEGKR
jgi:hypothetical protein